MLHLDFVLGRKKSYKMINKVCDILAHNEKLNILNSYHDTKYKICSALLLVLIRTQTKINETKLLLWPWYKLELCGCKSRVATQSSGHLRREKQLIQNKTHPIFSLNIISWLEWLNIQSPSTLPQGLDTEIHCHKAAFGKIYSTVVKEVMFQFHFSWGGTCS